MRTQIDLLKQYGLEIRGMLGQHLLIDPNVQRKTIEPLELSPGDWVFEIGPGLGALTAPMLARGARVLAVEKDPRFVGVLEEIFAEEMREGKFLLEKGDILEADLPALWKKHGVSRPARIAGNLPYYITAPILFQIFEHRGLFSRGVFTIQQEVAARMFAGPGTQDYGRLSVMVRLFSDVTHAFDISPQCFTPQPKVRSSVVICDFRRRPIPGGKAREQFLMAFVKAAFSQRRKKLVTVLARHAEFEKSKEGWAAVFRRLGLSEDTRAEELLLKDFMALADAAGASGGD